MNRKFKVIVPIVLICGMAIAAYSFANQSNEKSKVVYHLNEPDKAYWVLSLIRDHINTVGADNVEISLVTHGLALELFHHESSTLDVKNIVEELQLNGVELDACGFTMKAFNYKTEDLLPDMVKREEGGTVRLANLQTEGYVYIKPGLDPELDSKRYLFAHLLE